MLHGCEEPSGGGVHLLGSTLREVLDEIVTADPDYVWKVEDGVVNLLPTKGVPDLLTVRIAAFDSGNARSLAAAGTYLLALPELRGRATLLGFSQAVTRSGLGAIGPIGTPAPKLLKVRLRDVSLLDALNALVRANEHGEWVYHETHCESASSFVVQFPE
jgi:hypothetical protein